MARADASVVGDIPAIRRFLPLLLPRRNDAVVYFEQQVEVTRLVTWIDAANAQRGPDAPKIRLFHVLLAALTRTLATRPQLRRYVVGRRLWQSHDISLAFAVKKRMTDDASMTTVRVTLPLAATLDDVVSAVEGAIGVGRGAQPLTSEREMAVISRLPTTVVAGLLWLQRALDAWGLLPAALLRDDPLYASAFVANLGSVGLDAGFHHLFEYGSTPIFLTIGRVDPRPWVDDDGAVVAGRVLRLCWSYDERIADGYYAARSLDGLAALLREPQRLAAPPAPTEGPRAAAAP